MRSLALVLAATSALVVLVRPAAACSPTPGNSEWQLDTTQASDTTPPGVPSATVTDVVRNGESAGCSGGGSCGSIATIHLAVAATDDRARTDQIGYELTVVGGEPPDGLDLEARVIPFDNGELEYHFDFNSPSFSMDLEIRAVDANGNLGPPVVITVEDSVDSGAGCATGGNLVGFGMLAFATAFVLRRRRR